MNGDDLDQQLDDAVTARQIAFLEWQHADRHVNRILEQIDAQDKVPEQRRQEMREHTRRNYGLLAPVVLAMVAVREWWGGHWKPVAAGIAATSAVVAGALLIPPLFDREPGDPTEVPFAAPRDEGFLGRTPSPSITLGTPTPTGTLIVETAAPTVDPTVTLGPPGSPTPPSPPPTRTSPPPSRTPTPTFTRTPTRPPSPTRTPTPTRTPSPTPTTPSPTPPPPDDPRYLLCLEVGLLMDDPLCLLRLNSYMANVPVTSRV